MPATKRNAHGLTLKEEKFCLRYITHGIEYRAYAEAFNASEKRATWLRSESSRLMLKPEIQQRVRQLHLQLERSAVYDHRQCLLEAQEAYIMARDLGDARGMVAAAQLKAKVSGLIVEKKMDVANIGDQPDDELRRERERLNDELRALGAPPLQTTALPRLGVEGPRGVPAKP